MLPYVYIAAAQLNDGSETTIDLEERGWADKEVLARTVRWTLIPKDGALTMDGKPYPIVSVRIPEKGKPVFKTRVYAMAAVDPYDELPDLPNEKFPQGKCIALASGTAYRSTGTEWEEIPYPAFRVYAIGYKLGKKTHWLWVLPTGDIEAGDDSWFADLLLRRMKNA